MDQTVVYIQGWDVTKSRLRPIDQQAVDRLAKSMGEIGLLTPITVCLNGEADPILVAGAHRVMAAQKLGWDKIDAFVMEGDEIDRKMVEIAENLHRLDLKPTERAEHIRQYADLLVAREQRIVTQAAEQLPRPVGRPKSVTTKIAEATGLSHDTVDRALNPKPRPEPEPMNRHDQDYLRLVNAWRQASEVARTRFMQWLDEQ